MPLITQHDRIPPVRGIIFTRDVRGDLIDPTTLKKWIRLNAITYKAEKIDVILDEGGESTFEALLDFAPTQSTCLSLRCAPSLDPGRLADWKERGLFDVLLCTDHPADSVLTRWLDACRELQIPYRLQILGPLRDDTDVTALAERFHDASAVNITIDDPFLPAPAAANDSRKAVERLNSLTAALAEQPVEVNLQHLPFCHVNRDNLSHAQNRQQFLLDHQQYSRSVMLFAEKALKQRSHRIDKALEIYLSRQTSFHNIIDNAVLPWVFDHRVLYVRIWAMHKLTRHLRLLRHRPEPLPETESEVIAAVDKLREQEKRSIGPICAECAYRAICSHATEAFRQVLPGLDIDAVSGEVIRDPLHFNRDQPKHYDAIDEERREPPARLADLAGHVRQLIAETPPTREFNENDYALEDHETHPMPGAVRWFSFTNAEIQSTVLTQVQAPFTLSVTFGGGFAAYIGFSFGPHAKIYCPMIAPGHVLQLHVNEDGHFVLLRDGEPVRPTEFEDSHYLPRKLAGVLEPRIAVLNVDGQIVTQRVLLWDEKADAKETRRRVRVSVVIVSTCYSRRLQAVLLALANQIDIDFADLEVVVGYVPGVDATDDLLDSLRLTHPNLHILRSPFPPSRLKSKGLMINVCADMTTGDWVVLLDSDIMLPPDFLATLLALPNTARFAAPDGRRMLTPLQTAEILLGESRPWEDYAALAETDSEYRHHECDGIPPGFCQCVRREVFEKVRYPEFDHFEGADWWFAKETMEQFGPLVRFEGMKVIHLDHGGSQWYGAEKQM